MRSHPVINQKPVGAIRLGEVIIVGGLSYQVVDKFVNLDGEQVLKLEDIPHPRFSVKLIMPSHLVVTTYSKR